MRIEALLSGVSHARVPDCLRGIEVSSLVLDSRKIVAGDVFVAVRGTQHNGEEYIAQALNAGAALVLHDIDFDGRDVSETMARRCVGILDLRHALGVIAARLYNNSSDRMCVVGVTGTDGKTSTSHFIAQLLSACGHPHRDTTHLNDTHDVAVIGTVGNGVLGHLAPATHTTPDAIELQKIFSDFEAQGIRAVAMEVSSHALDQGRVSGAAFDVAVLTNLARDHMDYHHCMRDYAATKARLFSVDGVSAIVINGDDDFGCEMVRRFSEQAAVYVYGFDESLPQVDAQLGGKLQARHLKCHENGLSFDVTFKGNTATVECGLMGAFNAHNVLAAMGVALALGSAFDAVIKAVAQLHPVQGRMQRVLSTPSHPTVLVDYAHTPQALNAALNAVRQHLPRAVCNQNAPKLLCVFGCGGDRDTGKRALMGEVATRHADVAVLTDDNPRTESPHAIFEDVLSGVLPATPIQTFHDRAQAIDWAIAQASEHDFILIAGKGHENYQIIGDEKIPFCDVSVAQAALSNRAPTQAGGVPC